MIVENENAKKGRAAVGSGTVIAVACHKGGVGKSTVAAKLSLALAQQGHKALLVDCCSAARSLDLFFGITEDAIFDFCDAAQGRVCPDEVVIPVPAQKNLFLCCAPYRDPDTTLSLCALRDAVRAMMDACGAKFALLDLPAADSHLFSLAAGIADRAIIVSTPHKTALRAAERTNLALRDAGVATRHLLLNGVPLHERYQSLTPTLLDAVDACAAPLLGVVPYDAALAQAQDAERVATRRCRADTEAAFSNLAQRLFGAQIPLLRGFRHTRRTQILKKKP